MLIAISRTFSAASDNDSNEVLVKVSYEDNAGNKKITSEKELKIDVTKPVLKVEYDNNQAINETYYNQARTATITIDELNFNSADVKIHITKDGKEITNISPRENSWKNNGITHTAKIAFAQDGDYTIEVSYTDLADNKADYEHKDEFTIDITKPVVSLTYDNNQVENGNYYKEQRQATLVMEEHNFNANEVNIEITALDKGQPVKKPTVTTWITEGDRHTATILFSVDGQYTLSLDYVDMAGNVITPFEKQEFTIDTTLPELEITGVEEKHAYNDERILVITYSDTNFIEQQVDISITGYKRGDVSNEIQYLNITNGKKAILDIFPLKQEYDDYYILTAELTDKAGNTVKKELEFSINRFGSVYSTDEKTKEVVNSYIKEEKDLVVMETNVDSLTEYNISCSKDGTIQSLKSGQHYGVEKNKEADGWNQYIYTIYRSNFKEEGNYVVLISSTDKAGNLSDNGLKKQEIKFSVDKSAPKATISGLADRKIYDAESVTAHLVVKDNLMLRNVEVKLNGETSAKWNEAEIQDSMGDFQFDVSANNERQNIQVTFEDAAGNKGSIDITEFLITQNRWVQFYNNKEAVYASVGGGGFAVALMGMMIVKRKKGLVKKEK